MLRADASRARSYNFRKYILRQNLPRREPLYHWED